MLFKAVLLAFALLNGASSARQSHGGLALEGLLKFLADDQAQNLRGPENRRRLQTVMGPNGETTTKEEIKNAILEAIGATGEGKGPYDGCVDLFNSFDADGNGLLSVTEVGKLIEQILSVTEEYGLLIAEEFIQWYDADGAGSLNPEELEAACKGDPHFVTWYGSHFSYHGACDLVLVSNPEFASGKGLDIHVRTSHMLNGKYSFVSEAAIKIGSDVLEVAANGSHLVNGVANSEIPTRLGGFAVNKRIEQVCRGIDGSKCYETTNFYVFLLDDDVIEIKVASGMVHVNVKGSDKNFHGSVGIMGTYPAEHHGKIARDGETFIREADTFAQEWQVRINEPKLFNEARYPQFPQACIPAVQVSNTERRLNEDVEARLAAEEACAHVEGQEWEFCVFDVLATGDYGMAATIYGN